MINNNGTIQKESDFTIENNRGFLFGDSIFETLRVNKGKILFLEDHYFRLMASMRICRMEIPMAFTMEFIEEQIFLLLKSHPNSASFRIRFSVFRKGSGFYLPSTNDINFIIVATALENDTYLLFNSKYEVELYKDAFVSKNIFSTLKTNNKMIHTTASIYANENGYKNCLLLNEDKNVVEAIQSNIFMKTGNTLVTPPLSDGCMNGIMRKQILNMESKLEGLRIQEKSISPFDLQKADELFLTNVIQGIQPITKYRKKEFETNTAITITALLNHTTL